MNASKKLIIRLSRYKNSLKRLKSLGFIKVFSDNLADAVGVTPSQVRKDFSIFGIPGNKRGGYLINDLLDDLSKILGKEKTNNVIIIGAGNIGNALMNHEGFKKEGIKIIAAFDNDQNKINKNTNIPVYYIDKLSSFINENSIKIAIIAVPDNSAQSVMDIMIKSGIQGILNFSSVQLRGNEDTIIHDIYLQTELESLVYFVNASKRSKDI